MEKVNQWLSVVANLGVVLGLVFLGIEIQQNTQSQDESRKLATAQAYQSRAEAIEMILIEMSNSEWPEITQTLIENGWPQGPHALDSISAVERTKLGLIETARWTHIENVFYQHQQGYVDKEFYRHTIEPLIRNLAPYWEALGRPAAYRPSFVKEIERIVSEKGEGAETVR